MDQGDLFRHFQYYPFLFRELGRFPPYGQQIDPLLRFASFPRVLRMLIDTIGAAIDLGGPYLYHLPVQKGYLRCGYEIVKLNEWFVSGGLYVPHPESFFHFCSSFVL
jgi:hypothetical protein